MVDEPTVYVVDDDEALRDSLDFLLAAAGFSVKAFESASSFLGVLTHVRAGCLVTDIRMPGMDGLELLKRLKRERPSLPVIVMTGHGDVPLAVEAMKLGASDFIEKPFEDQRLIDTIRAAMASVTDALEDETASAQIAARVAALSQRERQVLEGLVTGLSNKAIARDYGISPRTVEVYRANVMTKMQASNLSELVRLAMRAGVLKDLARSAPILPASAIDPNCAFDGSLGPAREADRVHKKPSATVYAVDDDPDVLASLRFLLETEGFAVKTFANGWDLLASSLPGPSDCLVIDYKMTGMDGLELIRHLRDREVSSPVVLVTVYEGVAAKAAAAGVRHLVMKPHIEESLVAHVRAAMGAAGAK